MCRNQRTGISSSLLFTGLFALLCFSLSGCFSTPLHPSKTARSELLEVDVNAIDTIDLQALSASPPVSLDTAAENFVREIVESETVQERIPLGIEDVRSAALSHNLDLKVQLIAPSIAGEFVNEERAKFEAVFAGSIYHAKTDTPVSTQLEGSQAASTTFEAGVRKPLPTGGDVTLGLRSGRYETDNAFSLLNPAFDSDLRLSISQPLLRNAGLNVNHHSIRVAQYQKKITDAQTKLEALRVLAQAEQAYWMVYSASRVLDVRQQQYERALRQLRDAKLRVKAESSPRIEITRAESGVAARLEGIIVATTRLKLHERDLKRVINRPDLPMESLTALIPETHPNPVGMDLDSKALAEFAVENRMEMLELELSLAMDESTIDFQRNAELPLFVLDYQYTYNGLGSSFGKSYDQVSDMRFADWSVGMRTEIPLGNQAAKSRVRRAVLQRVQRLSTKKLRSQAIRQETLNALDMLQQNWQRILAARQESISAARTFEAERRQFEIGVRTSTDVLYAADLLAYAQLREIQALTDYQIAQLDIAYATGTLLGYSGVSWQPFNSI